MTTKKRTTKRTTKRSTKRTTKRRTMKRPSKDLLRDLKEVFERHNWSGGAIGLHAPSAANVAATMEATASTTSGLAPTPGSLNCQPPSKPTFVTIHRPNGTLESGFVCL